MPTNSYRKKTSQWLALHFPHLALDRGNRNRQPPWMQTRTLLAISDTQAGRECIMDHNPAAEAAGVRSGMPVTAALGLADELQVAARDRHAEQQALEHLAAWSYQYSSQVSIDRQQHTLLLEVAASQRLFGTTRTLAIRLKNELEPLGYHAASGIAPTPEAACLAAQHGLHIRPDDDIGSHIGTLSISCLRLEASALKTLQKTGLRTVAEVCRLPRKALTRRLGPAASDYLDRLLGLQPDPRTFFHPPQCFADGMDVPEIMHTQRLLFPLKRLLQALCGVLRAHDCGITSLEVGLQLDQDTETIHLHLQQPARDETHLMGLLRIRLERLQLAGPVHHIQLQATHFLPCVVVQPDLLQPADPAPDGTASDTLLERLRARLGHGCVQGLKGLADHRPEYSWSWREPDEAADCCALPRRPLWLFPAPRQCRIDRYHILTGPERIETGWWDGHDCRRDYFVVRDHAGSTWWAFREYKPRTGWYLHGLFS